ncbi:MAG TPA: rhomboid family intramembrane serine protease [Pyrinomonadaceae bacterium]|nr:rhomboid family intramembrane serine protease [Pyrinomonadaceae bacterium]
MLDHQPSGSAYAGRPSVCRNCGALVGAGEKACAQCGAPVAEGPMQGDARRPSYDQETMRFARTILTRPATFTFIFLIANIFVFLLMIFSSGGEGSPAFNIALVNYGAKVNRLINQDGEWWRFVTPIFLHGSIIHLLFNMYGLWILGPYVERLYGSAKFVVFWILTGIAGVVASYLTVRPEMHVSSLGRFLFKAQDVPSVGASGALFGLVGVLFVFGLKFRHELPEGFKRAFGTGMLPIIVINLFIGFLGRGFIDNAAHLGGLVAGALLALVVGYKRPGRRGSVAIFWHVLQVAALALVALSFLKVALNYKGAPPSIENVSLPGLLPGKQSEFFAFVNAINTGQEAIQKAVDEKDVSTFEAALEALENAPRLDDRADAMRNELKALLVRAREYAATPTPQERSRRRAQEQRNKLEADFKSWAEKFRHWIETDSEKYGIQLQRPTPDKNPTKEQ